MVGVGAMTATGDGAVAGATILGPVTGADGAGADGVGAEGAGTIPEQQSRKMPSVVGQHSPTKAKEAQTG